MRQVVIHMMDCVDASTTNILSPDILPIEDLRSMLRHIESELSSPMHLLSSNDTIHFYWYLNRYDLIADRQFLLLIDVPIQNNAEQSTNSVTLPQTKGIPWLQCYIQILSPPHYEDHIIMMNVSLDTANINAIDISTLECRIWQHFNSNWTTPHQQKLGNVSEVPVAQLYKHMINTSEPVHSFTFNKDDDEDNPSYGQSYCILGHT